VVLLGQNVNSYWDQEALSSVGWRESRERLRKEEQQLHSSSSSSRGGAEEGGQGEGTGTEGAGGGGVQQPYAYSIAEGFTQRVRVQSRGAKKLAGEGESKVEVEGEGGTEEGEEGGGAVEWQGEGGVRFAELLSLVASIDPDNMRIRFQSPHPKDFPNEVIILASNIMITAPNDMFCCMQSRVYSLTAFLSYFLPSFLPPIHPTSSHSFPFFFPLYSLLSIYI
jgi:hypothetical protein